MNTRRNRKALDYLFYFHPSEFDSPDEPGSGYRMDQGTALMLDRARAQAKIPFKLNSAYRTEAHNEKVGGSKGSSHLTGYAVDIAFKSKRDAIRIIAALAIVGFRRMGMGENFIHVDADPTKPHAYWDYS